MRIFLIIFYKQYIDDLLTQAYSRRFPRIKSCTYEDKVIVSPRWNRCLTRVEQVSHLGGTPVPPG